MWILPVIIILEIDGIVIIIRKEIHSHLLREDITRTGFTIIVAAHLEGKYLAVVPESLTIFIYIGEINFQSNHTIFYISSGESDLIIIILPISLIPVSRIYERKTIALTLSDCVPLTDRIAACILIAGVKINFIKVGTDRNIYKTGILA